MYLPDKTILAPGVAWYPCEKPPSTSLVDCLKLAPILRKCTVLIAFRNSCQLFNDLIWPQPAHDRLPLKVQPYLLNIHSNRPKRMQPDENQIAGMANIKFRPI